VDVLYDERVNLVVAADAPPEALFTEGAHSAEFQRTASRLHEMRSSEYLASERRRSGGKVQSLQADGDR
jgi:cell division protein ZapE